MIIADDEEMIVNGLANLWDWSTFDIQIVGTARNGQDTLEQCRESKPDILLTDINMPYLNGIEVAQSLKEFNEEIVTIIISGIKDFNYAKDAIALNASAYLLKPIKIPELKKVIEDTVANIKEKRKKSRDINRLKIMYKENLPVLRTSFLKNILHGVYLKEEGIVAKCRELTLDFYEQETFQVAVAEIEEIPASFNDLESRGLLLFSIQNITEELMAGEGLCVQINDRQIAIILLHNQMSNVKMCESILNATMEYLNTKISIGLGNSVNKMSDLHHSYTGCLEALNYRFYTGNHLVIAYDDIMHTESLVSKEELLQLQKQLLNSVMIGNKEQCLEYLQEFNTIVRHGPISKKFIETICLQIIIMLYRKMEETHQEISSTLDDKFTLLQRVSCCNHLGALINELEKFSIQCCDAIYGKIQKKNNYIIQEIVSIVEEKYQTRLTVNDIASYVNLTPNYVSQLFKRNQKISLNQYMTKYRIEKAKELLKRSDFKIYEVADMVGFDSPYYFSTVFKKHTGYHPSMYKDL